MNREEMIINVHLEQEEMIDYLVFEFDQPKKVNLNEELALAWLAKGAIPTDTVKNILSKAGIMKKFHDSKSGK